MLRLFALMVVALAAGAAWGWLCDWLSWSKTTASFVGLLIGLTIGTWFAVRSR